MGKNPYIFFVNISVENEIKGKFNKIVSKELNKLLKENYYRKQKQLP